MSSGLTNIISVQTAEAGLSTGSSVDRIIGTKTSGPRGIESVIGYNGIFLNKREWIDTYIVKRIEGIDDADVVDSRDENPGTDGETPGPAKYSGRTLVLQGEIYTKTLWKMRDMHTGFREAFVNLRQELPLTFYTPDPENNLQIFCKKSQKLLIVEEQTTLNDFKRDFSVTLRASNPRFLSTLPAYNSLSFEISTFDDIGFTAINNGNYFAQPVFHLTGPFTTLTLINEKNDNYMSLINPIPAGEEWIFDMAAKPQGRFYRRSDNAPMYNNLDNFSQNIYFEKKENPIKIEVTGADQNSLIEVRHHHSYM